MSKGEFVTAREGAIQLRTTLPYLYALLYAERIPGAYKEDGEWRVPVAAVTEYRARRESRRAKQQPTAVAVTKSISPMAAGQKGHGK